MEALKKERRKNGAAHTGIKDIRSPIPKGTAGNEW